MATRRDHRVGEEASMDRTEEARTRWRHELDDALGVVVLVHAAVVGHERWLKHTIIVRVDRFASGSDSGSGDGASAATAAGLAVEQAR